jgi:hypothetical protein
MWYGQETGERHKQTKADLIRGIPTIIGPDASVIHFPIKRSTNLPLLLREYKT